MQAARKEGVVILGTGAAAGGHPQARQVQLSGTGVVHEVEDTVDRLGREPVTVADNSSGELVAGDDVPVSADDLLG